jgi:hypothetical protein
MLSFRKQEIKDCTTLHDAVGAFREAVVSKSDFLEYLRFLLDGLPLFDAFSRYRKRNIARFKWAREARGARTRFVLSALPTVS